MDEQRRRRRDNITHFLVKCPEITPLFTESLFQFLHLLEVRPFSNQVAIFACCIKAESSVVDPRNTYYWPENPENRSVIKHSHLSKLKWMRPSERVHFEFMTARNGRLPKVVSLRFHHIPGQLSGEAMPIRPPRSKPREWMNCEGREGGSRSQLARYFHEWRLQISSVQTAESRGLNSWMSANHA